MYRSSRHGRSLTSSVDPERQRLSIHEAHLRDDFASPSIHVPNLQYHSSHGNQDSYSSAGHTPYRSSRHFSTNINGDIRDSPLSPPIRQPSADNHLLLGVEDSLLRFNQHRQDLTPVKPSRPHEKNGDMRDSSFTSIDFQHSPNSNPHGNINQDFAPRFPYRQPSLN